jgi:hypothetical protein
VEAIARRLFGPRRYWDMGAASQKADICRYGRIEFLNVSREPILFEGYDEALGPGQTAILTVKCQDRGEFEVQEDFRVWDVSFVKDPLPGREFLIAKPVG